MTSVKTCEQKDKYQYKESDKALIVILSWRLSFTLWIYNNFSSVIFSKLIQADYNEISLVVHSGVEIFDEGCSKSVVVCRVGDRLNTNSALRTIFVCSLNFFCLNFLTLIVVQRLRVIQGRNLIQNGIGCKCDL